MDIVKNQSGWMPSSMDDFRILGVLKSSSRVHTVKVSKINKSSIRHFAVKKRLINIGSTASNFDNEVRSLVALSGSPFFPVFVASFYEDGLRHNVTSFIDGVEMKKVIQYTDGLSTEHIKFYAAEITEAITQLHARGLMHRKLYLSNVTVRTSGHVVLTGLTATKVLEPGEVSKRTWEINSNLAPEMFSGKEGGHSFPADLWGLGLILYTMASGVHPFDEAETKSKSSDEVVPFLESALLKLPFKTVCKNSSLTGLVKGLLTIDQHQRLTLHGVRSHQFFHGIDWDLVSRLKMTPPNLVMKTLKKMSGQ